MGVTQDVYRYDEDGKKIHLTARLKPQVIMRGIIKRLATRLKRLGEEDGLTQGELTKRSGLSHGYPARLEISLHDPSLGTLDKLAKALRETVGKLVEGLMPKYSISKDIDAVLRRQIKFTATYLAMLRFFKKAGLRTAITDRSRPSTSLSTRVP